jgi:uncharacterized protein YbaP (TraB family)
MIRKIACFVFLLTGLLNAQPKTSLLWKISGNGLKTPSYIYGTIHSFDKRAFTFDKLVTPYIKKCDAFGMEIKLDEVNPFSLLGQLTMPGDTTLKMLVADSDYKKFESLVRDSFHIELAMFSQIKPMFLMGLMETNEVASDYDDFLDEYLMKKAKSAGKECIGIETVEEQLHAIDLVPLKEQAKMLVDETLHPDTTDLGLDDLLDIYKRGDLDSLYSYYKAGELSNEFNKALVTDRNHRMADRIDSIAHKKSIFVAVGALHLPGNEGVLNLLRKKGYEVGPVNQVKK